MVNLRLVPVIFALGFLMGLGCSEPSASPPDAPDTDTPGTDSDGADTATQDTSTQDTHTDDTGAPDSGSADTNSEDTASGDTDTKVTDTDDTAGDSGDSEADAGDDATPMDPGVCLLTDTDPDFTSDIGCFADYEAVAAPPLASSIPGVLSSKTVVDRLDNYNLYFQNSRKYPIHYDFASTHLSGNGLPMVTDLALFNQREYYATDRRFVLGALNYYEGPKVWAYEIAPYDTASAEMIEIAFDKIREHLWVGDALKFHPTSDNVAMEVDKLPADIPVITTEELFKGITYQPLNLATAMGQLRFLSVDDLDTQYLSFRDIAVLDAIPNDISVCSGTITQELQTPLAHINVLAQNRGTPNMALVGAFDDPELRALEGKWVSLTVGAQGFTIAEVDKAEADAWWEAHKPAEVLIPTADVTVTDLRDIEDVLEVETLGLGPALAKAIPAFGGKASHFAAFPHIQTMDIPYPDAFVVPIFYYKQFMALNGIDDLVAAMMQDPSFVDSPAVREQRLQELRDAIEAAPLDPGFETMLNDKLAADFPGVRMRFRSSTNCEDLGGFTGAGLYTSKSGDPDDPESPVADAVRQVWASVWKFRAFEERAYRSISQQEVGMALLVHRSYPTEAVNGVGITANIFDSAAMEPGYYINAQVGDTSVVLPPEGVTSDQFLYHFDMPGQPIVSIAHSSLVPEGQAVMTRAQIAELAEALEAIHLYFNDLYGPNTPDHFYAMDVEFKFNADETVPGSEPTLVIKQARPYPGRGTGM